MNTRIVKQHGYVALYAVIGLGFAALSWVFVASESALTHRSLIVDDATTTQTAYLIESCIEYGLLSLYENPNGSSSGQKELDEGDCSYTVTIAANQATVVVSIEDDRGIQLTRTLTVALSDQLVMTDRE